MYDYPKVLLISHCVISKTTNNGKTMYSFFNNWDVNKLAEIYLNPEIPDTNVCKNYFRITDLEVLKSLFNRKPPGQTLNENDIVYSITNNRITNHRQESFHNYARKRKPYMYILRNYMWSLNTWKTQKLYEWIDRFDPDVVLYVAGSFTYSYKVALHIAQTRGIPLVPYFSDDHYLTQITSISPLYWLNRLQFKKTMKKMLDYATEYICICDEMTKEYTKLFNKVGNTLMTATSFNSAFMQKEESHIVRLAYIGNLNFNRWKQLIEIGKIVHKMQQKGINIELCIYSGVTDRKIINALNSEKGIIFKGKVSYSEVLNVMNKSDILLHVESFDKVNRVKTKYSISTKIPDSLLSGRCIFAYGPSEVASIKYLHDNKAACVVSNSNLLEAKLVELIKNSKLKEYYISNALNLAKKNHSSDTNKQALRSILSRVAKTKNNKV